MKKQKENTKNEVLVPSTRQEVPNAITTLENQLAELKKDFDDNISLDVEYNRVNVATVRSVSELVKMSSSLRARAKSYKDELEFYDLSDKVKPFSENGKTEAEWLRIFKKAIYSIINKQQVSKIEKAISSLSEHLDEDTKLRMKLEKIVNSATELMD